MSGRILVVDDEPSMAGSLEALLSGAGWSVDVAGSGGEALARAAGDVGLVLCDLRLPDMDGLEVFERLRAARGEDAPVFVILTAYGTVSGARDALKAGVFDYLTKPIEADELLFVVQRGLDQRRLRLENRELSRAVGGGEIGERLVGRSPAFLEMLELARAAARSEATVLIRGESGTGKELVAELIHAESARAQGPLVRVNCGAIPEPLLEAELFGHERGAFTDARRARKGRFELAQGGTIFLDEVGEMSAALQVKLLRVLQERQVERLGGQGRAIPLDLRVIAATHQDLEAMVREGTFREDLYYRIDVVSIQVPPLRERPEDVGLLARTFCARFAAKNRKPVRGLSAAALARLQAHRWPGNVRELENALERAVVLGAGEWLEPGDLELGAAAAPTPTAGAARPRGHAELLVEEALAQGRRLEELERDLIVEALRRTRGNVTQAARLLGLTRRTLQYRVEKHGLEDEPAGRAPDRAAQPAE